MQGTLDGLKLEGIKQRQQTVWASGDYSMVATYIVFVAEQLIETADVQAGERVLDVATGSGNVALAAARRNADVLGVDYVPALLERGRIRAEAEHLGVEFALGDAEALPVEEGQFDVVTSVFGAMFAPDHRRTASELARACRPGGKIALASWTPQGFIGEMFRLMGRFLPPAPGLQPPVLWGDESHLRDLFGASAASVASTRRIALFKWRSAGENVEFFRRFYGPTISAFDRVAASDRDHLAREMENLARRFDRNRGKGPISIEGEYLETVIVKA